MSLTHLPAVSEATYRQHHREMNLHILGHEDLSPDL